ncbi:MULTISPECIES: hypothetical protein [Paenibacillus]|uniref:hypothetical protein n=1 Tax=Paenibacillus TaxID=44249 RepID=UPI0022B8B2CD|nr:hypothetical protein [Paenibacillus caseinilyticus]MCZ8520627.1 hypothetical protein [Paenibacillus caseinilyticus]
MYGLDSDLKLRIAAACELDIIVCLGDTRIVSGKVTEVDPFTVHINGVPYPKGVHTFWDVTLWGMSPESTEDRMISHPVF